MTFVEDYDKFWDREGRKITFEHWIVLHNDPDYENVAKTRVGMCTVSTMWVGVNMQPDHPIPHIFETQVFPLHPANLPLLWLYITEEEARTGHYRATQYLRKYQGMEENDGQTDGDGGDGESG